MRAGQDASETMIKNARELGRRTIVSRGWAELSLVDNEPDCLAIGEVNQQAIFKRVSAIVPTADSLTSALVHTLQPAAAVRAQSIASQLRRDGADVAARRLIGMHRSTPAALV
jgi:vancomycin aglycone glucosyltransferase